MHRLLLTLLLVALPSAAVASPALQMVSSARIVAIAQDELDVCLGADKAVSQVTVIGKPEDVKVLGGALLIKARRPEGRWPRARVGMPVEISVNGQVVRSTTVWFAISVHHNVTSYALDAPIGTIASSLRFTTHDADVAALQGDIVADIHQLDGMRLRHAVIEGSPVLMEDFERIPDVDRQQRVDVMASYGVVKLEAKGTSIGLGNAGDTVQVLVDGADAPIRARVIKKGVVQVVD